MDIFLRNISLAIDSVSANKFRAFLTALGIVFGVAAVIAMMAIGKGAQQAIIEQLEQIGTNNILISAISPQDQEEAAEESDDRQEKKKFSSGLGIDDVEALQEMLPNLEYISPELTIKKMLTYNGVSGNGTCQGVWNGYFQLFNLPLQEGTYFTQYHINQASPVCVVGDQIKQKFFRNASPLGKKIKCGRQWFTVIGVLKKKFTGSSSNAAVTLDEFNDQIFVPASTAIQRLENRSLINGRDIARGRSRSSKIKNYHQLDRILLKVDENNELRSTANIAERALLRRHNGVEDFTFDIPELLIKQRQSTQQTLNFVLAIIAGISLLVGGIGIMNIMLASVMERIREIGIRRSVGADQRDIQMQFLLEASVISLFGGIIGIILGLVSAKLIAGYSNIQTTIDFWSIILSFCVAVGVGLIFGFLPARKAAFLDPVKALRSD